MQKFKRPRIFSDRDSVNKINSEEYAAVPVRPKVKFQETFYKKYFIDRVKN